MARRSVLFSPGDRPDLMRKTPDSGADVVVFDLEDGVAPEAKDDGREAVNDVLTDDAFDPDCEVCVRVNPVRADRDVTAADLRAVLDGDPRIDSVMLPKTERAEDVRILDNLLGARRVDLPIIALCESAAGVLHAEDIAATDPVEAIAFGAEDLSADIGATRTREGTEVLHAREHVVLAAGAADVDALDTVFTDIGESEALAEETEFALGLGYDGKMCIHPAQVPVVNDAFTPADDRIEWAHRVLEAAAEAQADGVGVFRVDDEMIDAPLIARAEQVRDRALAADAWPDEG
ncbi:HpcH/HpaI aldolase/citrate lyase family protein [Haloglomus salinum]|jgi:citrate lyase subunit beta/citryl-CoA lyase|uniref:HpcH/HpaI aldolase/citrate lyase family protein n=1 Tax=Haloglomus salinum TaxID=2962673 RepID=UPI0020CA1CDA|nr:CoA ester lyase [Haloglomus salinum]